MKHSSNGKNGATPLEEPAPVSQNFGGEQSMPQLPPALEEKIDLAKRLTDQINKELQELTFGPGGEPAIPGLPDELIFKDELEKIKDIITGKYRLPTGMRIADAELTQSIQFFNFDNQSSGAGNDNSVPLIANKDLVIRVYIDKRPGLAGYVPNRVTGRIRFAGQDFYPLNGPIQVLDRHLIRRSNINHTLNFRIPAALCRGNRTFQVKVYDYAYNSGIAGIGINGDGTLMKFSSTTETFYATFRDAAPLRVCGVMVNYAGPGFNLPAPLGTDLPTTLNRFLPMFPIHGYDFGPCTVTTWGDDMRIKGGDKGSGWDSLLTHITNLRNASTIRAFFVGLLPTNLAGQIGSWQRGIGRPGVAIAAKDDTRALSHELGHAMCLDHLEDGIAGGPFDKNYPKYREGTFPFGTIGEFGINTNRMTLFDPADTSDLMTYRDADNVLFPTNTWISPYHYQRMLNALTASNGTGDIVLQVIIVAVIANFRVYRNGKIELRGAYIVDRISHHNSAPIVESMRMDILGRDGEIVSSQRCHQHNPYQDMDGPFVDYHEIIPWSEGFTGFSVLRNGEVIGTIHTENKEGKINLDVRRVERHGDMLHLKWEVESQQFKQPAMIRYSNDNGETWQAIAADVTGGSHLINLDLLPGGKSCRVEVIASGLDRISKQSEPFEVPIKPTKAYLYAPEDGETYKPGTPVTFCGGGYSPDHVCGPEAVSWHSSIQGYLGSGNQLIKSDLISGTHCITIAMRDGQGGEAKASVWITVAEEADDCKDTRQGSRVD
jgi:hypothetical protein